MKKSREATQEDIDGMRGVQSAVGLVCRTCGCRHFDTLQTLKREGKIDRRRECRNCGWRCMTSETVIASVTRRVIPALLPVEDDPDDFLT